MLSNYVLFPQVYPKLYSHKFVKLPNQMSRFIHKSLEWHLIELNVFTQK